MITTPVVATRSAVADGRTPPRAQLGCRVHLRFADGEELTLTLGPVADPAAGTISPSSPLGGALRDACAGDLVRYLSPAGAEVVRVLAVEPPAGHAAS